MGEKKNLFQGIKPFFMELLLVQKKEKRTCFYIWKRMKKGRVYNKVPEHPLSQNVNNSVLFAISL